MCSAESHALDVANTPVVEKMMTAVGCMTIVWPVFRIGYAFATELTSPQHDSLIGYNDEEREHRREHAR